MNREREMRILRELAGAFRTIAKRQKIPYGASVAAGDRRSPGSRRVHSNGLKPRIFSELAHRELEETLCFSIGVRIVARKREPVKRRQSALRQVFLARQAHLGGAKIRS